MRMSTVVRPFMVVAAVAMLLPAPPAMAAGAGSTSVTGDSGVPALPAPGPAGSAPTGGGGTFTFHGSGWGHGVGMSQYGAFGLAVKGWNHRRILRHFYAKTTVGKAPSPVGKMRVGLAYDRTTLRVRAERAPLPLRLGGPGGKLVKRVPKGKTWEIRVQGNGFAIIDHKGNRVGGSSKVWGGSNQPVVATPAAAGARAVVVDKGLGYIHGVLEFSRYQRSGASYERLVLVIPTEEYVRGIAEVPSSWPAAALRAQAVAARTFATYQAKAGLRSTCRCHLLDGSGDQTYRGDQQESAKAWVQAAKATKGQVVLHKGKPILAVYAASDGGHSDSVADVWHGGNQAVMNSYPYLDAACNPGEFVASQKLSYYTYLNWSQSYSGATLASRLGTGIGNITGFGKTRRGDGGRVVTIVVKGTNRRTEKVSGSRLRSALSLNDTRVWVNGNRNIVGEIRKAYDDVLCKPGLPTTKRLSVPGGVWQRFQRGAVIRNNPAKLTVWLKGPVFQAYLGENGPTGHLGLPVSGILTVEQGKRVRFQHGTITCGGGSCTVA